MALLRQPDLRDLGAAIAAGADAKRQGGVALEAPRQIVAQEPRRVLGLDQDEARRAPGAMPHPGEAGTAQPFENRPDARTGIPSALRRREVIADAGIDRADTVR